MQQGHAQHGKMDRQMAAKNYRMLGISFVVMLILMYLIMFTMIYSLGEFIQNINFFYMAVMMATPMTVMMPLMMGSMYPDRKLNLIVYVGCALLFVLAFIGIRTQALVGDTQFLRSMIPHHSGAILMCEQANIKDPEIKTLCGEIIKSQAEEIDQMKGILKRK
jgi:CDP-diglyceride synthetase